MENNYNIRFSLNRASKTFLNYILETVAGNRDTIKGIVVSTSENPVGTMANNLKTVVFKSSPEISVNNGIMTLKMYMPMGVAGEINYISILSGSDSTGQIVETVSVSRIDKLSNVKVDLSLLLYSYDS